MGLPEPPATWISSKGIQATLPVEMPAHFAGNPARQSQFLQQDKVPVLPNTPLYSINEVGNEETSCPFGCKYLISNGAGDRVRTGDVQLGKMAWI